MKTKIVRLMKKLPEYRDDFLYLLFVGVPTVILEVLIAPCRDYLHLY